MIVCRTILIRQLNLLKMLSDVIHLGVNYNHFNVLV